MDNLNDISSSISAAEEIMKIINAVKTISSSRIKKILKDIDYNTFYYERITAAMKDILAAEGSDSFTHPYFAGHDKTIKSRAFLVFSGDQGLAGAYNNNLLDFACEAVRKEYNPSVITVGNMAQELYRRQKAASDRHTHRFPLEQTLANARRIAAAVRELYNNENADEIYLIYTSFFGKSKNKPVKQLLLPIKRGQKLIVPEDTACSEILYLPSAKITFDLLIPQYLIAIIFDVLVQTCAGEQFARMNVMDASAKKTEEVLKKLRLQYNFAKQAAITNEAAETEAVSLMMNERHSDYFQTGERGHE